MPTFIQRLFVVLTFGLLLGGSNAVAQKYIEGQVIVKFPAGMTEREISASLEESMFYVAEPLVPSIGYYLLKSKVNMTTRQAINVLTRTDSVLHAQPDHVVTLRNQTPNDPEFKSQWGLNNASGSDIGALKAWKLGFGGKDRGGRDIVVAVIDGGVDLRHDDLKENIWVNKEEIPANGIDDDGNGYVDDINGWNAFDDNADIPANYHGTHVAGIIGARGNNNLNVTGVNWNVKIMAVAGASRKTSTVLKAYNYVLTQKKLFISSKGKRGANVVVTNSSFGIDYGDCTTDPYTAWNDIYDEMGKAGILSAAATPNNHVDVDEVGDVPTGCSSPYIVSVTNTTKADQKNSSAGYGATHVDLGAPGTDILSTLPMNRTGENTGTSMATPHVAGAIAFMHSVASSGFHQVIMKDPAKAAIAVKTVLLDTVDKISDLDSATTSGGRLNLGKAAKRVNTMTKAETEACFL